MPRILILILVALSGCSKVPNAADDLKPITQHEPWYTGMDPAKRPFATRQGTTITLEPSGATFEIPVAWVEWHDKFEDNLHLTRAQLDAVARGAGDWDREYASVCNAVLPFDRCSAHLGGDGWGSESVSCGDLQVRVYDLDETPETIERRIQKEGVADVRRFSGYAPLSRLKPPSSRDLDALWRRNVLSYMCSYGDYGGVAHVDFRTRRFGERTFVVVFMYTSYQRQDQVIASILRSFDVQ
jgi:hypothetical protein